MPENRALFITLFRHVQVCRMLALPVGTISVTLLCVLYHHGIVLLHLPHCNIAWQSTCSYRFISYVDLQQNVVQRAVLNMSCERACLLCMWVHVFMYYTYLCKLHQDAALCFGVQMGNILHVHNPSPCMMWWNEYLSCAGSSFFFQCALQLLLLPQPQLQLCAVITVFGAFAGLPVPSSKRKCIMPFIMDYEVIRTQRWRYWWLRHSVVHACPIPPSKSANQ